MTPKKAFLIALAVSLSLFVNSCKEQDDSPVFSAVVTGTLLDSCNGDPRPDVTLVLWDAGSEGNWLVQGVPQSKLGSATTDENGQFVFNLKEGFTVGYGYIMEGDNVMLAHGCFSVGDGETRDLGELIFYPFERETQIKMSRVTISKFKRSDRIIIRQAYSRDWSTRDDTIKGVDGENLLTVTLPIEYQTKHIHCTPQGDSAAFEAHLIHLWDVSGKSKSSGREIRAGEPCTTEADTFHISRP
jgi:hypothetical protein